jgi:hypothetical protein
VLTAAAERADNPVVAKAALDNVAEPLGLRLRPSFDAVHQDDHPHG